MEFSSPPKKYKSALRMLLLWKMQNLVLQPIQSCQDQLAAITGESLGVTGGE